MAADNLKSFSGGGGGGAVLTDTGVGASHCKGVWGALQASPSNAPAASYFYFANSTDIFTMYQCCMSA